MDSRTVQKDAGKQDTGSSAIRVLLVEDHEIVRTGLRLLIGSEPSIRVVGEAGSLAAAWDLIECERPDIVILDLMLGEESGLDLLEQISERAPGIRVLVLTGVTDPEIHLRAVQFGALGLVRKEQAADQLLKAICRVHDGEVWLERTMIARVLNQRGAGMEIDTEADRIARLTEREREIIKAISEGHSNREVADRLFLSESTVHNHMTSIFAKLKVKNRLALVIYAFQNHLGSHHRSGVSRHLEAGAR